VTYLAEVLADAPLGVWPMDECTGTIVVDHSGNGRDGTYISAPILGAGGSVPPGVRSPLFQGGADDARINQAALGGSTNTFTMEIWARYDASVANVIMRNHSLGTPNGWLISPDSDAHGGLPSDLVWYRVGSVEDVLTDVPTSEVTDVWVHYVVRRDGTDSDLFLNGVNRWSETVAADVQARTVPWHFMHNGAHLNGAKGYAAWAALYDYALSDARIAAHHAEGLPLDGPCGGWVIGYGWGSNVPAGFVG
jgi:hypothetical protein